MDNAIIEQAKKQWYIENAPIGKRLGYPECCINEFCAQPPIVLKNKKVTEADKIRFNAAIINGKYTGFIPCYSHALQIRNKEITLASLIRNRDINLPPFPF